jgi:ABC-2 type transport system permease protein
MLLGRSLRDIALLLAQALILIGLAIPFGLELNGGGILVSLAMLALIGLVMSPVSYMLALVLQTEDALAPTVNGMALPLLLLSGVMLPMSLAPDWLQTLSKLNPLYHAVAAIRSLFNANYGDSEIVFGVALLSVLAVVAVSLGARTFSRAAA